MQNHRCQWKVAYFLFFVLCLECKLLSYRPYYLQQHLSEKIIWGQCEESGECDSIFTDTFIYVCVSISLGYCFIQIEIQKPVKIPEERVDVDLEQTNCEVCGGSDREDRLLLCDGCDAG